MIDDTRSGSSRDFKSIEEQARERVEAEKGLYSHIAAFVLVNAFLFAINLLTSPGYLWAMWPLLGWGLGLGLHVVQTSGFFGRFGPSWEERKVQAYMLQHEHGLTAAQVKQLMHDELAAGRDDRKLDMDRLVQRLENLEAIVTSLDWQHVENRLDEPTLAADDAKVTDKLEERTQRIASKVR